MIERWVMNSSEIGRRIPSAEESQLTSLIDITEGEGRGMELLAKDLHASGGVLQVLVHPYYEAGEYGYEPHDDYIPSLQATIEASEGKIPVVVYEAEDEVAQLSNHLFGTPSTYLVRTFYSNPTPAMSWVDDFTSLESVIEQRKKARDVLITSFKNAGTKRVEIGGRYCCFVSANEPYYKRSIQWNEFLGSVGNKEIAEIWTQNKFLPIGCVGMVLTDFLRNDIPVSLSEAVSPHTISQDRDGRYEITVME